MGCSPFVFGLGSADEPKGSPADILGGVVSATFSVYGGVFAKSVHILRMPLFFQLICMVRG